MQDERITCNGKATFEFGVKLPRNSDIDPAILPLQIERQYRDMIDSFLLGVYDKTELKATLINATEGKFNMKFEWDAEWSARKADYDGITAADIDNSVGVDIKFILEHKLGLEQKMDLEVVDWQIKNSATKMTDVHKKTKEDYVRE